VLAIVEDDPKFASILMDLAHEHGFKGLVATNGRDALALARRSKPDAITLDIKLPDMDGWRVLDSLKRDPETRHIPVNVMSAADPRNLGTRLGAFSVLPKPMDREVLRGILVDTEKFLSRKVKQLLIVEDDEVQRGHIVRTIGNSDVESTCVSSGAEALAEINAKTYDCVILDLGLGDMDGAQVLREIRHNTQERLPVIIYTARDLTKEEQAELSKLADSVIHKDTDAIGRLFDDCALFLHRVVAGLPEDKQELLASIRQQEPMLEGRKILIVDDDVRNVFSLASALEQHKMDIVHADNARDGISILEKTPGIDLILMDIMMPEMDGYETMRAIRARNRFKQLPIIAITAKAMTGDREKCMEAGASDYLAKPVDIDQIVSMMRIWLQKSAAA
jgi:CheY-like chemotaxis protein